VVKSIQAALDDAAKHPIEGFPPLQSVSISAQTTVTQDVSGQFKLFVFTIGAEKTVQNLSSITFELKPPQEAAQRIATQAFNPQNIQDALARQIAAAKVAFLDLKQINNSSLSTDQVTIVIGFEVTKSGNGGLDVSFITLISSAEASLTGKVTKDANNSINAYIRQQVKLSLISPITKDNWTSSLYFVSCILTV